jgi:hypothetical protein
MKGQEPLLYLALTSAPALKSRRAATISSWPIPFIHSFFLSSIYGVLLVVVYCNAALGDKETPIGLDPSLEGRRQAENPTELPREVRLPICV